MSEGYRIFSPGIPKIEDVKMKEEDRENSDDDFAEVVKKRLSLLLRRERINEGVITFYVVSVSQIDPSFYFSTSALFRRRWP